MKLIGRNKAAFVIIALAVVFIAVGAWRGEIATVLRKAVTICMECMGLG